MMSTSMEDGRQKRFDQQAAVEVKSDLWGGPRADDVRDKDVHKKVMIISTIMYLCIQYYKHMNF